MRECPCSDCPRKGCGAYHSVCKDYTEWDEENKRDRLERLRLVQINDTLTSLELARNRSVKAKGALRHGKSLGRKNNDEKMG